jgi:DNA invertase Pin-like site-specific DNA recombinase
MVEDTCVYVDDGISGAEFQNRPGFLRLMNALKPRPPFHVLVMSEESRLGREAIETAYALKQLVTAGVRVFFYLEDRERTLDSPTDKIMMSLTAFADELEREKARQRTADAMQRKARAGHVTGGRVFGYDNMPVMVRGADGQEHRSHVERRINEREAAVVRQIFELTAQTHGKTAIAKRLNEQHAPAPRSQQRRPCGWSASSVHEVLYRPLYRGELVYNRTRKRNAWGQQHQTARPQEEWIRRPAPTLRIVPEDLWQTAHRYLADARSKYLRGTDGRLWGRPRTADSKYLLPGFARCVCCNGVMHVRTRAHGTGRQRRRVAFYGCTSYWKRGSAVCGNRLEARMDAIDTKVLAEIARQVLSPDIVEEILERAAAAAAKIAPEAELDRLRREVLDVEAEIVRFVEAIGRGGDVPELLAALKGRRERKTQLLSAIGAAERHGERHVDGSLKDELRRRVSQWQQLISRHTTQARQILRKMMRGRTIQFEPTTENGEVGYRFRGEASVSELLAGLVNLPLTVASPTGFEPFLSSRLFGHSQRKIPNGTRRTTYIQLVPA